MRVFRAQLAAAQGAMRGGACHAAPPTTTTTPPRLVSPQVVFVTTEVAPWSKVGGLGDVMAALPSALASR